MGCLLEDGQRKKESRNRQSRLQCSLRFFPFIRRNGVKTLFQPFPVVPAYKGALQGVAESFEDKIQL